MVTATLAILLTLAILFPEWVVVAKAWVVSKIGG